MGFVSPIGRVLNKTYRIDKLLGEGGMGVVYEVFHLRLGRRFAMKLLGADIAAGRDAMDRFRQEAMIIGQVGHPHIVEAVDFDYTPEGVPFIVMELLEGEDLANVLRRDGMLDIGRAASILRQSASALNAAHERGIVHRDLKPQNIYLCHRGKRPDYVKVLDFGISKVLSVRQSITRSGLPIGTPGYMAPEQIGAGTQEIDARADVFAMGIILYEMIAGRAPFVGKPVLALLYEIVNEPHTPLPTLRPEVSEAVSEVVDKALAKEPEDRYESMIEFSEALADALTDYEPSEHTEDRGGSWTRYVAVCAGDDAEETIEEEERKFIPGQPDATPEDGARRAAADLADHFALRCDERQLRFAALASRALAEGHRCSIVDESLAELHDFFGEAQFIGFVELASTILALIELLEKPARPERVGGKRIRLLSWGRQLSQLGSQLAFNPDDPQALREVIELRPQFKGEIERDLSRVLICDDSLIVRSVLAQAIEELGYSVEEASDAGELEEKLEAFSPDVVFLDVNLPSIQGDEACRRIRARAVGQAVPIIMLSSLSDEALMELSKHAGADGYMSKRHDWAEIGSFLEHLLPPLGD